MQVINYRNFDKSLARPWKETSYSYQDLQHTKTCGVQTTEIYSCCLYAISPGYSVVSLGRCGLFPSRVGLRTYQHPCRSCCGFHIACKHYYCIDHIEMIYNRQDCGNYGNTADKQDASSGHIRKLADVTSQRILWETLLAYWKTETENSRLV